ncbi:MULTISPECIES: hypothetical protein [Paenarthrobacter]|uniref:Uncharacterized protein n=1 Tax=Paenarthrobacter ureafaciens TaxID=37931 RepID=A0AAX3EE68_PAEUR|nr:MULTISPECIES: hypothetical protein [Paenarthrobacter]NKR13260.1 hypothetical protein [Arthrobacter sp. M5]NKR14890.1 hypothetical protein [Arthrobacter sp. M6]OEH62442.1 hypothetical protein A5N13_01940 [Arthrobacter sp. D4]OEH63013.1 hypothetical protein A5N17_10180 [Arthrobacter sp. D2]MDO5865193.1 hypothetical protein [Paenarthrobacter sp. SD-2]
MYTGPISNGMLLGMTHERRSAVILELSPDVRRKLAHIASLGAERETEKAAEHFDKGRRTWADTRLDHAQSLTRLAAELTGGPDGSSSSNPSTPDPSPRAPESARRLLQQGTQP